jgi:hypothetical protein
MSRYRHNLLYKPLCYLLEQANVSKEIKDYIFINYPKDYCLNCGQHIRNKSNYKCALTRVGWALDISNNKIFNENEIKIYRENMNFQD